MTAVRTLPYPYDSRLAIGRYVRACIRATFPTGCDLQIRNVYDPNSPTRLLRQTERRKRKYKL